MIQKQKNKKRKREILIIVTGLNPQVITETLYYFTLVRKPRRVITEIFVITTRLGKERILNSLLIPKTGIFYLFCKEYGIDHNSILFKNDTIFSIYGKDGTELDDIRTNDDNNALANMIIAFIKKKTEEDNTIIHCSITGGRKTMSLYLGTALQFYGRKYDTLSHVLISPPEFETHNDFYYIPKKHKILNIRDRNGNLRKINTRDAIIELAEIPYIRLRNKFTGRKDNHEYNDIIKNFQVDFDAMPVVGKAVCNLKEKTFFIHDKKINLQPLELSIYLYFLQKKVSGCKKPEVSFCEGCTECFQQITKIVKSWNKVLTIYKKFYGKHSEFYKKSIETWQKWNHTERRDDVLQKISKINRKIKNCFDDERVSSFYVITGVKKYHKDYGIRLDRSKIEIVEN